MNTVWQKCWDVTLILADKVDFGFCAKHSPFLPCGSLALERTSCHVEKSMRQRVQVHVSVCASGPPAIELSVESAAPADRLTAT